MKSEQLLDPEIRAALLLWPSEEISENRLAEARESERPALSGADRDSVVKTAAVVSGCDSSPDITMLVYRPAEAGGEVLPCIFHMHGGGFCRRRTSSWSRPTRRCVSSPSSPVWTRRTSTSVSRKAS